MTLLRYGVVTHPNTPVHLVLGCGCTVDCQRHQRGLARRGMAGFRRIEKAHREYGRSCEHDDTQRTDGGLIGNGWPFRLSWEQVD